MRRSVLRQFFSHPRSSLTSSHSPLTRPFFYAAFRNMSSSSFAAPTGPVLQKPINIALIQLAAGKDKAANLTHAASEVAKAAASGSKLCVLPECFNSPYGTNYFPEYAEVLVPSDGSKRDSPSYDALSKMAKDNDVFLVGGSIPELNPATGKYHNTSLIFGPDGALLATHRKVHLFDIDIPGKITFRESDVLSPGNQLTMVDLPSYGRIAVAICYDIRFPELATIASRRGAFALIYPGAFNLTTGPLHWKLLAQARAVDNQLYVAMCSPARDMDASYHAYGHSMLIDPMAQVVCEAEEDGSIVAGDVDPTKIAETRRNIALNTQRRFDVYPDVSEGKIQFEDPDLPKPV